MWLLWALRLGTMLVPLVPARLGYWMCRGIGISAYLAGFSARRRVMWNLRQGDPRASELQLHRAAIGVFTTVVTNYYDLIRMRSADRDEILGLLDIHGVRHLETAVEAGRGVIVLSAHLGNFSVVARYPALRGWPTAIIAERIHPPALDAFMVRLRSADGLEIISQGPEAARPILNVLHRKGVLILAADRDIAGNGHPVPFFGTPAHLPAGPVLLAMHTGAALLPAFTIRRSSSRSDVYIDRPIEIINTGDRDADLANNLRTMAATLERMIATDPAQWAVLQTIWEPGGTPSGRQGTRLGGIPATLHRHLSRQA
ncbi:lysophospholipid acyltransferase family protein [Nitrolancea hollandica]|uniref:Putative lipid A biosynthesis lauroyl acyltransferase n=1 Tax=Nitrolancea hollandica Lb TaxID=1129897 RepID=I4ENK6_9BACT|nr:lysophospholipid acyltransferase family protein [Nitrolancea hollandica]CCF86269.1 putative lipid A biosynthesis lauroyl acyltransferase [Nitrolancea hollandica Lb]